MRERRRDFAKLLSAVSTQPVCDDDDESSLMTLKMITIMTIVRIMMSLMKMLFVCHKIK